MTSSLVARGGRCRTSEGPAQGPSANRCQTPDFQASLTDAEMAAYGRHPDTFFGVVQPVSKQISDPLGLFDFFHTSYRETPRERLLEFLAGAPDIEELKKPSQPELAKTMAERYVWTLQRFQAAGTTEKPVVPTPTK